MTLDWVTLTILACLVWVAIGAVVLEWRVYDFFLRTSKLFLAPVTAFQVLTVSNRELFIRKAVWAVLWPIYLFRLWRVGY